MDRDSLDLLPYSGLHGQREAVHPEAGPCFICEGRFLVDMALEAGRRGELTVLSVLCNPTVALEFEGRLPAPARLLLEADAAIQERVGFAFHRGVMCCVTVPPPPPESAILDARRLLVLPRVDDLQNLGLLLRSAAALGMDAVLLGRGPAPFERRTVRLSMGAAWRIPVLRPPEPDAFLERWRDRHPDGEVVGAALAPGAEDARTWSPAPSTALVLGPEGPGLDAHWLGLCDRLLVIPMARDMDSLNLGAAGAVLMWRLSFQDRGVSPG